MILKLPINFNSVTMHVVATLIHQIQELHYNYLHAEFTNTLCPNFPKFIFVHFLKLQYSWHILATNLQPYAHLNVQKIGIKDIKILPIYFTKALYPQARFYVQRWTQVLLKSIGHKVVIRTTLCPFMYLRSYLFLLEINDKHDFVCYNAMASHLSLRSNIIYKMITM